MFALWGMEVVSQN